MPPPVVSPPTALPQTASSPATTQQGIAPSTASSYAGRYIDQNTSIIWNITAGSNDELQVDGYSRSETLIADAPGRYHTVNGESLCFSPDKQIISERRMMRPFFQGTLSPAQLSQYEGEYANHALRTAYTVEPSGCGILVRNRNGLDRFLDLHYLPILIGVPATGLCEYPCDTFLTESETIGYFFITFTRDAASQIDGFVYRDDEGRKREMFVFRRVPGPARL